MLKTFRITFSIKLPNCGIAIARPIRLIDIGFNRAIIETERLKSDRTPTILIPPERNSVKDHRWDIRRDGKRVLSGKLLRV